MSLNLNEVNELDPKLLIMIEAAKKAYDNKDYSEAERIYTQYLQKHPSDAEVYYQRGMCKLHGDHINGCLEDFKIALSLEPKNPYRHSTIAFIQSKLGNTSEAIASYHKAIELDPDDAIALNNLGILEEKNGNIIKAKKLYDHADLKLGIKTTKTENKVPNPNPLTKEQTNKESQSKASIMKSVFTNKDTFKEFLQFIKGKFQ